MSHYFWRSHPLMYGCRNRNLNLQNSGIIWTLQKRFVEKCDNSSLAFKVSKNYRFRTVRQLGGSKEAIFKVQVPLRSKKPGIYEELLGFARSRFIVTRLSCATTPPLPAFLNLYGICCLIKSNQFLSNSAFPLSYRKSISWLSSFKICSEICFLALSSCVFFEESSSPRNNSQLMVSQTDFRMLSAWFDSLT